VEGYELTGPYSVVTPPSDTSLATWLEDAKAEIDIVDDESSNSRLMRLIRAAVKQVETDARLVVMSQTLLYQADEFPCDQVELRRPPISSLLHVKHYTGGVLTTLSPALYQSDLSSNPARIRPVHGASWPCTDCRMNAVQVQFICGHATAAAVPEYLKHVILSVVRGLWHDCDLADGYWAMIRRLRTEATIS